MALARRDTYPSGNGRRAESVTRRCRPRWPPPVRRSRNGGRLEGGNVAKFEIAALPLQSPGRVKQLCNAVDKPRPPNATPWLTFFAAWTLLSLAPDARAGPTRPHAHDAHTRASPPSLAGEAGRGLQGPKTALIGPSGMSCQQFVTKIEVLSNVGLNRRVRANKASDLKACG